ncbi:homeodomain-like domain-containing protein [Ditylenchus destructor]|uniref:Homeodomain-like domain-containing protein n=1 Tax=Ditylenchus destructor TaxID=166010 RepID=A0AAD4MXL6_9BILA|nr:homeodomain-like domain-containing protein [Ditylenchus destructor]
MQQSILDSAVPCRITATTANSSVSKPREPRLENSGMNDARNKMNERENSQRSCAKKVGPRLVNVMVTAGPALSNNEFIDKNNDTNEPETSSESYEIKEEPRLMDELVVTIPVFSDHSHYLSLDHDYLSFSNTESVAASPQPKRSRIEISPQTSSNRYMVKDEPCLIEDVPPSIPASSNHNVSFALSISNADSAARPRPPYERGTKKSVIAKIEMQASRSSVVKDESCLVHEFDQDIPGPSNYRNSNKQRANSEGVNNLRYSENFSTEKAEHENSVVKDEPSLIDELAAMIPEPSNIDDYLIRSHNDLISSNTKKSRKLNLDPVDDEDDRDLLFSKDLQIVSMQRPDLTDDSSRKLMKAQAAKTAHEQYNTMREIEIKSNLEIIKNNMERKKQHGKEPNSDSQTTMSRIIPDGKGGFILEVSPASAPNRVIPHGRSEVVTGQRRASAAKGRRSDNGTARQLRVYNRDPAKFVFPENTGEKFKPGCGRRRLCEQSDVLIQRAIDYFEANGCFTDDQRVTAARIVSKILGINHQAVQKASERAKAKETPESTLPICCPKRKKTGNQRRQEALEEVPEGIQQEAQVTIHESKERLTTRSVRRAIVKASDEGLSLKQIAKIFDKDLTTVRRIVKKWKTEGTIENKPSGPKPKYNETVEKFAHNILKEDPSKTASDIVSEIHKEFNLSISHHTASNILERYNSFED